MKSKSSIIRKIIKKSDKRISHLTFIYVIKINKENIASTKQKKTMRNHRQHDFITNNKLLIF